MADTDTMTVEEVGELLGLSRNTVYKLANEGTIPSFRLGRKLRFFRKDVQAMLTSNAQPAAAAPVFATENTLDGLASRLAEEGEPRLVLAGDDLLVSMVAHHLSQYGVPTVTAPMSSYAALVNLFAGNVDMALVNLYDYKTNSYNVPYVQRLCPGVPVRVTRLAKRNTGFFVRSGNPKNIRSWSSLLKEDVRIATRSKGSADQVLLDEKLLSLEANVGMVHRHCTPCETAGEAVNRVAAGAADVCLGTHDEGVHVGGVQFMPMVSECVDVVFRKTEATRPAMRLLDEMTANKRLQGELERILGLDLGQCGAIAYEC